MLSKCADCKYHHPELCAVNPSYRVMQGKLRSRLSDIELDACEVGILPCNDWEPSVDLQPLALELTLSRQEWKQLLAAGHGLPRELFDQLRTAIAQPGEIVMHPVESSNIAAIGYDSLTWILRVEFLNGTLYDYLGVPLLIFENFQEAPSKGRFLNSEIKGEFDYERIA